MANEESMRRIPDDVPLFKFLKLWPLFVALVGVIAGYVMLQRDVHDHTLVIDRHEIRLNKVELNAAIARINTDAIVQKILTPAERGMLESQVNNMSSVINADAEGGTR